MTDAQLLSRFIAGRDEETFTAIRAGTGRWYTGRELHTASPYYGFSRKKLSLVAQASTKTIAAPVQFSWGCHMSRPLVVCLCGSTRLMETAFWETNRNETLHGNIVLSVGVNLYDEYQDRKFLLDRDSKDPQQMQKECQIKSAIIKEKLDSLHRHKIDMADVVIFLRETSPDESGKPVPKPLGSSTALEEEYAKRIGKHIDYEDFSATRLKEIVERRKRYLESL